MSRSHYRIDSAYIHLKSKFCRTFGKRSSKATLSLQLMPQTPNLYFISMFNANRQYRSLQNRTLSQRRCFFRDVAAEVRAFLNCLCFERRLAPVKIQPSVWKLPEHYLTSCNVACVYLLFLLSAECPSDVRHSLSLNFTQGTKRSRIWNHRRPQFLLCK